MNITKFDLYNPEWLELVFDNRNKAYGAYDLRKHYAGNLSKAMGIAFFGVSVAIASFSILHRSKSVVPPINDPVEHLVPVVLNPKLQPPKGAAAPKAPSAPTIKNLPMVVAPDPVAENPVTLDEIRDKKSGTVTSQGKDDGTIDIPEVTPLTPGGGGLNGSKDVDKTFDANFVEVMPEPYGGAAGWSKFLQKNLRYPSQASEAGKHGKVFLSFIVEKDGHLSNITVEKGIGYGLDEEAVRVLKLAPAWKPGIQNGHAVRVKYTIPFNFQMPDPDNG